MGNCCGGASRNSTSRTLTNDIGRQKSKREQLWAATGQISLRDGNLKEIPNSVARVGTAAKTIDASNNCIERIPEILSELPNLQRLILANNKILELPSLATLQQLKVLVVDSNKLTALPSSINTLKKLERLQCSKNALMTLPDTLAGLSSLVYLDCSGNKIAAIPSSLGEAFSLQELKATDNYLQAIPLSLGKLRKLRKLQLDNNQIKDIPSAVFQGCESLQTLSLHSNPLSIEKLQATEGYAEFEKRRCSKVNKQISGGAMHSLDEGFDRTLDGTPNS